MGVPCEESHARSDPPQLGGGGIEGRDFEIVEKAPERSRVAFRSAFGRAEMEFGRGDDRHADA